MIAKERTTATYVSARNSVTGVTKSLFTGLANAEYTETDGVTAFTSTGFNLSGDGYGYVNRNTYTYVGWNWLAGGTASSNGNGSITSSVSANTTAGFSIISFTGDGNAGATVGHGLSQAPEMWITKSRSATGFWYAGNVNYSSPAGNYYQHLSLDAAQASDTGVWNGTLPSSTVITLGNLSSYQNVSTRTYISYAFHSVEGYSKVGSYNGNGSTDGSFIYTGMAPAFIMVKRTDSADNWAMYDSARDTYNVRAKYLLADSNQAEATFSTAVVDFLSNGFKWKGAVNFGNNSSGSYIYLAFAESPFKTSNAR